MTSNKLFSCLCWSYSPTKYIHFLAGDNSCNGKIAMALTPLSLTFYDNCLLNSAQTIAVAVATFSDSEVGLSEENGGIYKLCVSFF